MTMGSGNNITVSIIIPTKDIAEMMRLADLIGPNTGDAEAASQLQPVIRGTIHDWMKAIVEESCHRILQSENQGAKQ